MSTASSSAVSVPNIPAVNSDNQEEQIGQVQDGEEQQTEDASTPKSQYRLLKRRFKFLVYENECYQEELRNLQRKLLKLSRDKNFLMDRLTNYEKLSDSSDESDSTMAANKEQEKKPKRKPRPNQSRKKPTVQPVEAASQDINQESVTTDNCLSSPLPATLHQSNEVPMSLPPSTMTSFGQQQQHLQMTNSGAQTDLLNPSFSQ